MPHNYAENAIITPIFGVAPGAGGTAQGHGQTTQEVAGVGTLSIPLSRGKCALIDEEDLAVVAGFPWRATSRFGIWYAVADYRCDGDHLLAQMHRVIMSAPRDMYVDHQNGDGLDNRRCNLRICDNSQNQQNRYRLSTNTSGYRGVTWNKAAGKWQAAIKHRRRSRYLGLFSSKEDAARAYDKAALETFGEFACLNFPPSEAFSHA